MTKVDSVARGKKYSILDSALASTADILVSNEFRETRCERVYSSRKMNISNQAVTL